MRTEMKFCFFLCSRANLGHRDSVCTWMHSYWCCIGKDCSLLRLEMCQTIKMLSFTRNNLSKRLCPLFLEKHEKEIRWFQMLYNSYLSSSQVTNQNAALRQRRENSVFTKINVENNHTGSSTFSTNCNCSSCASSTNNHKLFPGQWRI